MNVLPTERATELVRRFAGKKILVVGDVMLDRYVFGRVERLNPEAPVPILHAHSERLASGGAGNTAKNAAALGAITTLVGVIGNDSAGEDVLPLTRSEGYRAILVKDAPRKTTEKRRYVVGSQQMLRVDREDIHAISGPVEEQVVSAIETASQGVEAIIVSDFAKGVVTPRIAAAMLAAGKREGVPVAVDVKPSAIALFKGASCISPNRKEAHEFLGLNYHLNGGCPPDVLAPRLRETFATDVFLTLGESGIYICTAGVPGRHVPQAHGVEIADTSGCGDTALVAIILARLAGATDVEAAQLGNAAGALIASKVGAVAARPQELLDLLLDANRPTTART